MEIPSGQWVRFEVRAALGKKSGGTWSLTVSRPGKAIVRTHGYPAAGWKSLNWLGFVSHANHPTAFYLDDLDVRQRAMTSHASSGHVAAGGVQSCGTTQARLASWDSMSLRQSFHNVGVVDHFIEKPFRWVVCKVKSNGGECVCVVVFPVAASIVLKCSFQTPLTHGGDLVVDEVMEGADHRPRAYTPEEGHQRVAVVGPVEWGADRRPAPRRWRRDQARSPDPGSRGPE